MRTVYLALFILSSIACVSQTPAPTFKLFLIGDAGEGDTTGATLHDLRIKLLENPNSAVVFLGDNCYLGAWRGRLKVETGGFDGSKTAQRRVMSQLNILRQYKGQAYFIPGNHDWYNMVNLEKAKKYVLLEEKFIEDTMKSFKTLKNEGNVFVPSHGEAGPVSRNFNDGKTRVIFVDTYRLIIAESKPKKADNIRELNTFYKEMDSVLTDATKKGQKIVVVAHHPIHAKGKHAQPIVWWQSIVRRFADSNTNYPPYNKMASKLDSLLKAHHHPDIYFVSGHEHSLEYFYDDSLHYLISGAGSRIDKVDYKEKLKEGEYFVWNEEGFFEIEFFGKYEKVVMYHRKDNKSELEVHCLAGCDAGK
jgi:UDP-2,3-diacylglucosamine pyrophosphatase LpxH